MTFQLEVLPHAEWAASIADLWAKRLFDNNVLTMALSAGGTSKPVYREMAGHGDFPEANVFLVDEYGLAAGDPGRSDGRIEESLFSRLGSRPSFHSLDPQASDLDEECNRYAAAIERTGLNLTILGLGVNGRLGLNEPGSRPDAVTRVVALADETIERLGQYGTTSTTSWGMTIGLFEILASDEAWLLVSGEHKAQILRRTLIGPVDTDVPASFLRAHNNVIVWVDEAAASQLV